MKKSGYAVRLDRQVLNDLKEFCVEMGYKQSSFVEKALREQMAREELKEDLFDLITLRSQEVLARPFRDYDDRRG